jgi:glycosyltransferase involved in cell wall biosynthesis
MESVNLADLTHDTSRLEYFTGFKKPESEPGFEDQVAGDGTDGDEYNRSSHQFAAIKLSILMSAYNEERTIIRAINEVLEVTYPCEIELIVVDDGSTDATPSLLEEISDPRVAVHSHDHNKGKGAGLLSAASLATGTHLLPFDADLEYAPEDIVRLLDPVIKGRCDVVYGVRLFGCNTVYQSYRYAVGNKMLTRITNILYDSYLNDLHTCLKLIPLTMFKGMHLSEAGFGLDTQVTAILLRGGIRPFEVPVSYYSRSHKQGKKITWRDAVKCVWILLKTRIRPREQGAFPGDYAPGHTTQSRDGASPVLSPRVVSLDI